MAEQQTVEFVEVRAEDLLAEREEGWRRFKLFLIWSTAVTAIALLLLYLLWG